MHLPFLSLFENSEGLRYLELTLKDRVYITTIRQDRKYLKTYTLENFLSSNNLCF